VNAHTLHRSLRELSRLAGVRAVLATTEHDGLPAASVASVDIDAEALAAFAMALFRRVRLANEAAGYGATRTLVLDASGGRLFVSAGPSLAIVVLTDRDAGAGLVRVAMQRAAGAVT
jgi:predicted regulator of Ras-like GTPase activity (Roadblock/LC7/MglB family)